MASRTRDILKAGGNGRAAEKKDSEPPKKAHKQMKYTGTGTLHESITLGGLSQFVSYRDGKLEFTDSIDEPNRVIRPSNENEPKPYEFRDRAELEFYFNWAKRETLDTLWIKVRSTVEKFNATEPKYIDLITANILASFFQDRLPMCHYIFVYGHPGTGKGAILETFHQLSYRAALVSNATAANVYRLLGSIEKASVSLLIDEANSLEDDVFLMEVLKTGFKQNGMVPRIMDASSSTAEQVFYHTYCFKVIAAERLPIEYKAEGLLSRCFTIKTYPAEPRYKIDKVAEPGGDPLLVSLNSQLQKLRKLLFAYRLIHYDDPIHDVKLNIDGRDEELCSGLVRLFQKSKVLETVFTTLYEFVKEKRQNKTDSLEQKILVITKEIIDSRPEGADKYSLEFATIWNTLKDILKGKDVEGKPQSMTTAYGTLSFRVLTQMLIKFGAKRDKDANGARVLKFDETRLNKFSGLYDVPEALEIKSVDTSGTSGTLWEDIEEYRGEKSIDSNAKVANIQEKVWQFGEEVIT